MRLGVVSVLSATLVLSAGCRQHRSTGVEAVPDHPELSPSEDTAQLAAQLQAAKDENLMLSSRVEEQLAREARLSRQLTKLKFLSEQQRQQIKALADAPSQRDALRQENLKLSAEIAQLKAEIKGLAAEIASLKTAREGQTAAGSD